MMPSSSHDLRSGWRTVSTPTTGPIKIVQITKIVISVPAVAADSPWADTR